MIRILHAVFALLIGAFMLFVWRLIAVAGGYVTGWIVGWFFTDSILLFAEKLGITGLSVAQIGAVLAFIGSFLSARITTTVND